MLVYVKQVHQTCDKQLDWAPAETLAYHYGKIAGASPLQFSGELLETGGIHNLGYGKIAWALPLQFSGELLETYRWKSRGHP